MKKLSDSELIIMSEIWKVNRPLYFHEILELVQEEDWAETTVRNFLQRIVDKGYLEVEKEGRKNIYIPKHREDYINKKTNGLLGKLYDNSLKNFISQLYDADSIDDQDLLDLRDYLDEKIGGS